jgi:cinnamoyl-CoA:phenyllactate CoA-transferase
MFENRPLSGVNVVELATFVAAPSAARFFADQGADVIKIEAIAGDGTRWAAGSESRPVFKDDMEHNLTFELENGNKRGLSLNLKNPECFDILMKILAKADIFITNWRPQALARLKLDYESLKEKFPKIIYATATGYGEKGPDCDLPGYDFTAFWARSGILGSLYEKGTMPMNLIPSMGDRATGMCLAAGILAALYRAAKTGKGEKVSASLMGTAIFMQGTMIQSAQYGLIEYPIKKQQAPNPIMTCYQTKDHRWIQICLPIYQLELPKFAKAMGREEWLSDPRFATFEALDKDNNRADFYNTVAACFAGLTTEEAVEILTKADIPFSVAQVWKEVLKDPQAWANDCFYEVEYKSGKVTAVRNPIQFEEAGKPPLNKAPRLGQHSAEILKGLGYNDDKIAEMIANKDLRCD